MTFNCLCYYQYTTDLIKCMLLFKTNDSLVTSTAKLKVNEKLNLN